MAPASGKATYKSYEAQARLVRAIVAAHPDVKWNYKEIVACYGSDMTKDALNHRFRHLKAEALIITEGRKQGFDMKDLAFEGSLPGTQNAVDTNDIAKYFGQSTPDGIQFQFRTIKQDANKLRQVENDGGDVATALASELGGGGFSTPSGSVTATPTKPTPRRPAPVSGSARKRTLQQEASFIKPEDSEDGDGDDEFPELNIAQETPSKRPKTTNRAPKSNKATPRASKTGDVIIENSQSSTDVETPMSSAPAASNGTFSSINSIFGPVSPKKNGSSKGVGSAFKQSGEDVYVGSQDASASMYTNASFSYQDGEI